MIEKAEGEGLPKKIVTIADLERLVDGCRNAYEQLLASKAEDDFSALKETTIKLCDLAASTRGDSSPSISADEGRERVRSHVEKVAKLKAEAKHLALAVRRAQFES